MRKGGRKNAREELAKENFYKGYLALRRHPMFIRLMNNIHIDRNARNRCPENGWAVVSANGTIHVHPTRLADPDEWVYVLAHCALHLGLEHFQEKHPAPEWNTACDCAVAQFLTDLKLGRVPPDLLHSACRQYGTRRACSRCCATGPKMKTCPITAPPAINSRISSSSPSSATGRAACRTGRATWHAAWWTR